MARIKDDQGKTVGYEEKLARRNVWEITKEAEQPNPTEGRETAVLMDVNTLRKQVEDAIADQPDNVKRAVLDRFAERLEAGLQVQAEHGRSSQNSSDLKSQIAARIDVVDSERVARTTIEHAAAKPAAPRLEPIRAPAVNL